jgi:hypothetical protein
MPKAVCQKCLKVYWGWALKYGVQYCDCGEKLSLIEEETDV